MNKNFFTLILRIFIRQIVFFTPKVCLPISQSICPFVRPSVLLFVNKIFSTVSSLLKIVSPDLISSLKVMSARDLLPACQYFKFCNILNEPQKRQWPISPNTSEHNDSYSTSSSTEIRCSLCELFQSVRHPLPVSRYFELLLGFTIKIKLKNTVHFALLQEFVFVFLVFLCSCFDSNWQ